MEPLAKLRIAEYTRADPIPSTGLCVHLDHSQWIFDRDLTIANKPISKRRWAHKIARVKK